MPAPPRLNERAGARAGQSLWHVDDGWAMFAGPLDRNDRHAHSAAVYLAGLYGTLRLRIGDGGWLTCRSAVIRAGTPYEFDVGGEPLGVLYLEPSLAGAEALTALALDADEVEGALVGRGDASPMRRYFECRPAIDDLRAGVQDVIRHASRRARNEMDRRIARAVAGLQATGPDAVSATIAADAAGLSPSRFQHLFTREVGVPFRRYRSWHRLRTAIREVTRGANLTTAAHSAGFADQAHFSRSFRATFGAPPSRGL